MNDLRPIRILLVEDDEVDQAAIHRAFRRTGRAHEIVTASDGEAALEILRGSSSTEALAQPFLVLLDLNLPRLDGLGFLDAVRADRSLRRAVVFVLTTSRSEVDRANAFDRQVAGYFVKRSDPADLSELIQLLLLYWRNSELPAV